MEGKCNGVKSRKIEPQSLASSFRYVSNFLLRVIKMNIGKKMTEYRTDTALLRTLEKAAQRSMSPDEVRSQRVSYVMSTLKEDDTETKARVARVLENSGH